MSVVRVLPRDAEALVEAYASTASLLTHSIGDLGSLVTQANRLIQSSWHPSMDPVGDLADIKDGCRADERDLAWRLEWIQTHDQLDIPDGTRNLFDLIAQAEAEAEAFGHDLDDLDIPALTPLQEADLALHQIRDVLDTAKFDAEHGGIGTTVGDDIWSTEDLDVIIENEHGYYTPSQVAHARTVLAMATSSPEAREHLGITESGDGWGWDDIGHVTLDVLGMVPVVGNAADGINASWYAAEGEWLDAALSSMALIPVIGQSIPPIRGAIKAAADAAGIVFRSLAAALDWAKTQFARLTGIPFNSRSVDELGGGVAGSGSAVRSGDSAGPILISDPDFAIGQIAGGGNATASELVEFGTSQDWLRSQTATGPIKFTDSEGTVRLTIKRGSSRAPGSADPHIEIRNVDGVRVDVYGIPVTRRSVGNHTPIIWDLGS